MPFNGSGVYSFPSLPGSFNPAISGQQATPADWNTLATDLTANGLTNVICKDGQTTITANIPFSGFRPTGLGNATALTDATTAGQVQNARHTYALDTGSVNAFAIAPLPACSAYAVGQSFQFRAIHSNNTSAPTLNVSGLGAGTITYASGAALPIGALVTDGLYEVIVASNTPTFHLQTPLPQTVTGPTTQSLTSGTAATYTTAVGSKWIKVRMWGGGGGGSGVDAGPTGVAGTDGTASTFNSINAAPGKGGGTVTNVIGGVGGAGGSGTANLRVPGFCGESGSVNATPSGSGGGPGGKGGKSTPGDGVAAAANSSGGGSGAFGTDGGNSLGAPGGGSGEYLELIINSPAATYTYTIGPGGAGGVAANNGGAGGSGLIMVEEHYSF